MHLLTLRLFPQAVGRWRSRGSGHRGGSIVNRPVWLVPGGSVPGPWGGGRAVGSLEGGLSDRKGGGRGIVFGEGAVGDAWSACAPSELPESMVLGTASPGWRLNACVPSGLWRPTGASFGTVEPIRVRPFGTVETIRVRPCGTVETIRVRPCGTVETIIQGASQSSGFAAATGFLLGKGMSGWFGGSKLFGSRILKWWLVWPEGCGGGSFSLRGRWVMRFLPAHLRSLLNRWCLGPPAQAGGYMPASLRDCGTVGLWDCGTVGLWDCGTVGLWDCVF